jgi:MFS transporter, DHA2 family, methylenomycin A resistance protein
VPLGAAGSLLTARYAVETAPARDRGMDLLRQLAAAVGLAALASATIEAGSAGLGVQFATGGYLLAVVAGALLALAERARTRPMLPPRLFRSKTSSITVCVGLLMNVVFYGPQRGSGGVRLAQSRLEG